MPILFTDTGWKQYTDWQEENSKTIKRINQLLKSISRDGAMQGIGKPEALKHDSLDYSVGVLMTQTDLSMRCQANRL